MLPPKFSTPTKRGGMWRPFTVSTLTPDKENHAYFPQGDALHFCEPKTTSNGMVKYTSDGQVSIGEDENADKHEATKVGGVHMNFVRHLFGKHRHGFSGDNIIILVNKTGKKLTRGQPLVIPDDGDATAQWNDDLDLPNGVEPKEGFYFDPTAVNVMIDSVDAQERPIPCCIAGPRLAKVKRRDDSAAKPGEKVGTYSNNNTFYANLGGTGIVMAVDPDKSDKALIIQNHNLLTADHDNADPDLNESTFVTDRNRATLGANLMKVFKVFNRSETTDASSRTYKDDELAINLTPAEMYGEQVGFEANTSKSDHFYGGWLYNSAGRVFGTLTHVLEIPPTTITTAKLNKETKLYDTFNKGKEKVELGRMVTCIRHDAQFRYGSAHGRLYFVTSDLEGDDGETVYDLPIVGDFRIKADVKGTMSTFFDDKNDPAETGNWVPFVLIPNVERQPCDEASAEGDPDAPAAEKTTLTIDAHGISVFP